MGANGQPVTTAGEPPEEVLRLLPMLARIFDLGRGPPGLVRWVRRQRDVSGAPPGHLVAASRRSLLLRLARDLSGLVRSDELWATVEERIPQTVRFRPSVPFDPAGPASFRTADDPAG